MEHHPGRVNDIFITVAANVKSKHLHTNISVISILPYTQPWCLYLFRQWTLKVFFQQTLWCIAEALVQVYHGLCGVLLQFIMLIFIENIIEAYFKIALLVSSNLSSSTCCQLNYYSLSRTVQEHFKKETKETKTAKIRQAFQKLQVLSLE